MVMGCDIHGIVQARDPEGDWYTVYIPFAEGRSSALFSILAEVNVSQISIDTPRGYPEGFIPTSLSEMEILQDDSEHSHSWLYLSEILEYPHWDDNYDEDITLREWCGWFLDWCDGVYKVLSASSSYGLAYTEPEFTTKDIRIIFGFDN
jgi:hypothetical protein